MVQDEPETTVLVVDDEPGPVKLYETWLADEYEVRTAVGGEEGLNAVDDSVDVLLLDRRMPRISGDEVLAEVKRRGLDCRVIMVTAVQPDFDIIELGFDGYLTKPVEAEELKDRIEQVRSRAAYEHELQEYYGLIEKKTTLEAAKAGTELDESEEYAELQRRLNDAHDRLESYLNAFDDDRFASVIERTRSLAALREREQRYRSLTEDVLDTSRVGTIIVDTDGEVIWANAAAESHFGIERGELHGKKYPEMVREKLAGRFGDPEEFEKRVLDAHAANDGVVEFQCHVPGERSDEERWLRHWSKPIESGLYTGGRIEHYYDVTLLIQRERTLETLHGATRELIDAETRQETAERSARAAETVLGFSHVVLYLWEESSGTLSLAAKSQAVDDPPPAKSGRIWEAFVEGGIAINRGEKNELIIPLGNQGVLVVGNQGQDALSDADVSFARVLTSNTEVALERADRERMLRQRDEELERRNEQLERLDRINTIVRGIGRVLANASTRTEIEQAVCDRLVEVGSYSFVWAGDPDVVSGGIEPRAWAGHGESYLEVVSMPADGEPSGPAWEAIRERRIRIVENILEDPSFEPWRREALDRGYRSVASVPLVYEQSVYGMVEVYADRPFAFDDEQRDVLAELGETIGHAINAVKRKEALLTGSGTELEFEFGASSGFFAKLAGSIGGRVDLRRVIPSSNGDRRAFFSVAEATPEEVIKLAETDPVVSEVRLIRDRSADAVFECRVTGETVVTVAADHGAITRSVVADGDRCRVVLELPGTEDVREFAEMLTARYADAEFLARRERTGREGRTLQQQIDDRLTDRQREALEAAYFAGYYEWPRESDGKTVADLLAIAQPTLQQHLRAGERKLLKELFDGE